MAAPNDVSDECRSAAVVDGHMLAAQNRPGNHHAGDGDDLHHHENALRASAGFHSEAVDERERAERYGRDDPIRRVQTGELEKVAGEGDRYRRHASGLYDEQQYPSIEKRDCRVVGLAQVGVLASDFRQRGGQFSPDECAAHSDDAAEDPGSENQGGRSAPAVPPRRD